MRRRKPSIGDISVEIITGGAGNRPDVFTFAVHAIILIYFITFAVIIGIALHWPEFLNLWVVSFVAAGVGFVVILTSLAHTFSFMGKEIASNLTQPGLHYQSGLIHVSVITRGMLAFFAAIVVSSALQLSYLAWNTTCCLSTGVRFDHPRFVAAYLISLFYYHYGITWAIQLLHCDFYPIFQVPGLPHKSPHHV